MQKAEKFLKPRKSIKHFCNKDDQLMSQKKCREVLINFCFTICCFRTAHSTDEKNKGTGVSRHQIDCF